MDWIKMPLAEQLGNVGSEFERAVRWKQKQQSDLAWKAVGRTLDQIDRTLVDGRHAGQRRKEIARLREEVCRLLVADDLDKKSVQQLQRYFLAFATIARKEAGL